MSSGADTAVDFRIARLQEVRREAVFSSRKYKIVNVYSIS